MSRPAVRRASGVVAAAPSLFEVHVSRTDRGQFYAALEKHLSVLRKLKEAEKRGEEARSRAGQERGGNTPE